MSGPVPFARFRPEKKLGDRVAVRLSVRVAGRLSVRVSVRLSA